MLPIQILHIRCFHMSKNLLIVRAAFSGLSQRSVAKIHHVSRNTVALLVRHAKANGWCTISDLNGIDEMIFSAGLSSEQTPRRDSTFRMPDYEYVHAELAKPHVTLQLLWEEYVDSCQKNGDRYYMETQFRRYYHKFANVHKATIRLEHRPALAMEVDWAGTKIAYFDQDEGAMHEASLFVAVLSCSQMLYVEPFRDEKLPSWVQGHVNAFEYLSGIPKTVVPDNLRTGVSKSDFYAPKINPTYHEMATYYGTVILPSRVRRPNDKASAENGVLIASRRIIARLRNRQILSFSDLQQYVRAALEQINQEPLQGKSESRWTAYLGEEKEFMLSLPASPYQLAQWGKAKVQPNCHIAFQNKYYSVSFEYLGETVDVRATDQTLELFYHNQRIASHKRLWGKQQYSTVSEHMPPNKRFFVDWDRDRFLKWAQSIGIATKTTILTILDKAVIEQQAYRSCFGLLSLKNKYSGFQLERACAALLQKTKSPTYQQVKNALEKEKESNGRGKDDSAHHPKSKTRGFQRGAEYFGGDFNVEK